MRARGCLGSISSVGVMENSELLSILISFLGSIIAFLAAIVSGLVLGRISKVEKTQDAMKEDWMGRKETNAMVRRVEESFMKRYDEFSEKLDNASAEYQRSIDSKLEDVKKEVNGCAASILKNVALAMRVNSGEKINAGDILDQKTSDVKHEY